MRDEIDRETFIGRIGTFFVLVGLFALIIFLASDLGLDSADHEPDLTQTYIVAGIEALQTRDAGAAEAARQNRPTPTLAPIIVPDESQLSQNFAPLFCFGSLGLLIGLWVTRAFAKPSPKSGRFSGWQKIRDRQKEDAKKREEAKQKKKK